MDYSTLKPQGFYLNAQWITPPARMEFERYMLNGLLHLHVWNLSVISELF